MDIFRLVLGAALLTMGQRLFWLFHAGVGFVFGFDLAKQFIHGQPHNTALVIAFFAGAVGAILAFYFQKLAILAGGFIAGVLPFYRTAQGTQQRPWQLLPAAICCGRHRRYPHEVFIPLDAHRAILFYRIRSHH